MPVAVQSEDATSHSKLAILEDMEASGEVWFWAADSSGHLRYLSPTIMGVLRMPDELGIAYCAFL